MRRCPLPRSDASSQQPELLADPALVIKIKVDWGELNNWDIIVFFLASCLAIPLLHQHLPTLFLTRNID